MLGLNTKRATLGIALLACVELRANPVYIGSPLPATTSSILAILAEVIVAGLILGALKHRARSFLYTAVGMHLITYPAFIAITVALSRVMSVEAGIGVGELIVIMVEWPVYLVYSRKTGLNASPLRCLAASTLGNITSVMVGLTVFFTMVAHGLYS